MWCTTLNSLHVLFETPLQSFFQKENKPSLSVEVMSFGFKYGIPIDADLVFDVRFLPNPSYLPENWDQTGVDEPVYDYVSWTILSQKTFINF